MASRIKLTWPDGGWLTAVLNDDGLLEDVQHGDGGGRALTALAVALARNPAPPFPRAYSVAQDTAEATGATVVTPKPRAATAPRGAVP